MTSAHPLLTCLCQTLSNSAQRSRSSFRHGRPCRLIFRDPNNLPNVSLYTIAASLRGPYTTAEGDGSAVESRTNCLRLAGQSAIGPSDEVDQSTSLVRFWKSLVGVLRVQSNVRIELDLDWVALTIAGTISGVNGWGNELSGETQSRHVVQDSMSITGAVYRSIHDGYELKWTTWTCLDQGIEHAVAKARCESPPTPLSDQSTRVQIGRSGECEGSAPFHLLRPHVFFPLLPSSTTALFSTMPLDPVESNDRMSLSVGNARHRMAVQSFAYVSMLQREA